MLRIFARQGAVYFVAGLIARAVNFLALPVYARMLSPTQLGAYELILLFSAVSGIFITLEITQGSARYFHEAQSKAVQERYVSSAFWFTVIAYSLFVFGCALAADPISEWLIGKGPEIKKIFLLGLLACWTNGLCYFALNHLRWKLHSRLYAVASVSQTVFSQILALTLVVAWGYDVKALFIGMCIGNIVGLLVAVINSRGDYRFVLDWELVRKMLFFSFPLAISGLAVLISNQIDRVVIKELLDISDVGLYGVAARFSAVASVLLIGFQAALTPVITSMKNDVNAPRHLGTIFRYFTATALPIIFILSVFSKEFLVFMAGEVYMEVHPLVPLLALSSLLAGMYVFAPGLWLAKKTSQTLLINVSTAMFSIVLTTIMVLQFGLIGAGISAVIAALTHFVLTFWVSQRYFAVAIDWVRLKLAIVATVILSALGIAGLEAKASTLNEVAFASIGIIIILWPLVKLSELKKLPSAFINKR